MSKRLKPRAPRPPKFDFYVVIRDACTCCGRRFPKHLSPIYHSYIGGPERAYFETVGEAAFKSEFRRQLETFKIRYARLGRAAEREHKLQGRTTLVDAAELLASPA
jgi:hypothetical protein